MRTIAAQTMNQWKRSLVPAAVAVIGLITFISADVTGEHRVRAGGVAIVGAAVLMAITRWSLRRPDEAAQFERCDSAGRVTYSRDHGLLIIVRPDQAELYEGAVRALGASRVLYDRRQEERRRDVSAATIERRQSERRQRAKVDFDIKAFGSTWIRV